MPKKIVTGGQTGVDRATLDAAILLDLEYSGWCPKGRIDESGTIPKTYTHLKEISGEFKTEKENYDARTKQNIQDSDATIIIIPEVPLLKEIQDGTQVMFNEIEKKMIPHLVVDLSKSNQTNSELIINWIKGKEYKTLNIGGPRESICPGIYEATLELLKVTLPKL